MSGFVKRMMRVAMHVLCMVCIAIHPISPAIAQQIVTDGRTKTTVNVNGNVSDVHTKSVYGNNSYNSFNKFDVNKGNTVNIHIPDKAKNSINLVHGKQTRIDGTLNSVKGGKVGGNLYILNSHGVVVGPSGKVNTGSFSAQTPTKEFMDGVLGADGRPNARRAAQITDAPDTIPLSANGVIKVQGNINAVGSVELHGGSVDVSGRINTGKAGRDAIRAAVNLDGVEELGAQSGRVKIRSKGATTVSGSISASGSAGKKAGKVEIKAGGNVRIAGGARIDARGEGAGSGGGTVLIYSEKTASFDNGAVIDVSAGTSGDGGFVDFSAYETVTLGGGTFLADAADGRRGLVVIDPKWIIVENNASISNTADITLLAWDKIEIAGGVSVEATNGASILIGAPNVTVSKNARLVTSKGNADSRGDVTILAVAANLTEAAYASKAAYLGAIGDYADSGKISDLAALAATSYGNVDRKAEIVIDGAVISGGNVTIRAGAASEAVLYGASAGNPDIKEAEVLDVASFTNFAQVFGASLAGVNMLVSIAEAVATVDIKGGAKITADKALKIDAAAAAAATPAFFQYENAFRVKAAAGVTLGGLLASAKSEAKVNIGKDVTLEVGLADPSAKSSLAITADTKTKVDAKAEYFITGEDPLALAATVALGESRATANVAEGANIRATRKTEIATTAKAEDEFAASTSVYALSTTDQEKGGGVGLIATYGDFDSKADASFGGVDTTRADGRVIAAKLDVTAASNVTKSQVSASGKVSDDPKHYNQQWMQANGATFGQALLSPLTSKIAGAASGVMSKVGSLFDSVSIVGSAAIADIDQLADARLTRGVVVDGDITIKADVANKKVENFAAVEGKGQAISLGFALALPLALVDARAEAAIAPDRDENFSGDFHVDASGAITVDAKVNFPGPEGSGFSGLADPVKQNSKSPGTSAVENLSFLDPIWNSNLYKFLAGSSKFESAVEKLFFNSRGWATTEAKWETENEKAKTLSMAINTTIADFDNAANARIASVVEINRNGGALAVASVDKQKVSVNAESFIEYLTLTGDASLKGPVSGASGSTSLGLAFALLDISNNAVAQIESGAKVSAAGDVKVNAQTEQRAVTLGFSAGWGGGDVGINGAVGINFIDGSAKALVGDPEAETARAGTEIISEGGAVEVAAKDTMGVINLIGGVSQANNVGVSAGVAFNDINSTSIAAIDRVGRAEAARTLDIKAENDGFSVGAALSAQIKMPELKDWAKKWKDNIEKVRVGFNNLHTALVSTDDYLFTKFMRAANDGGAKVADNNSKGTGSDTSGGAGSGSSGPQSNPLAKAISDATGKFGINVSADAVVNAASSKVEATLSGYDATSRVEAGKLSVDSRSGLQAVALSGSVTVKKPDANNGAGTAGLAGSYSHNGFDDSAIIARISGIGELESGDVSVTATNDQQLWGLAAGGSAQAGSAAGAGSETANLAGSVNFNTIVGKTEAAITDTRITRKAGKVQTVSVKALDDSLIASLVGGAVYSQAATKVGIGAAGTANILETDTLARLSNVEIVDARKVEVDARSTRLIGSVALGVAVAGGSGSTKLSGAVSLAYNNLAGDISAVVEGGSIEAGSLKVEATDNSTVGAAAGDVAVTTQSSNSVTAGIATAVNNLGNSTRATVKGADLDISDDITIRARLDRLAVALAAGIAATKGDVAIKGSVAVNLAGATDGQTLGAFASLEGSDGKAADIDGDADGTTTVTVAAEDDTNIHGYAGAVAAAKGTAGIGAGIVVNKVGVAVEALVDNVSIDNVTSLDVVSVTDTDIVAVAASVGASENVAVSGAIVVNVFEGRSSAKVGSRTRIGADAAGRVGNVTVGARNDSTVASAAGSGAFAKSGAGIGGAVTIDVYSKTTTAAFDGFARLDGSLAVLASADDNAYGGLAAFGVGTQGVGVAGAIGVVVAENRTTAAIGSDATAAADTNADIRARGNVIVDAHASSDVIRANLAGGIGKSVGVGALVAVEYLGAATRAEIANGATVVALGQGGAEAVRTGDIAYAGLDLGASSSGDNVTADGERIKNIVSDAADSMKNDSDFADNDAGSLFAAQLARRNVRGISVTADSDARMINLGLALGVGGKVGVGAGATATASTTETVARIGARTSINKIDGLDALAHASQGVNVRAGSTMLSVSGSVGVGAAGKVGIGAGVDVSVGNRTTHALIDDEAEIHARGQVAVDATSRDTSVSVGVGVGAAGVVGVGGAVTIGVSDSETVAEIGDRVNIDAGAVRVNADSTATRFQVAGSGGFSGTAGVGASVSVLVDSSRTYARIGNNSRIDARREVIVNAVSDAAYRSFTVAAAGSGVVGVAASIAVKVLRSDTQAVIGDATEVTVSGRNSDGDSAVVSARSQFDLLAVTGGGGVGGKVGVGAGLDVMVGRATTVARVGKDAVIEGAGDVIIKAEADKRVNSTAIALGGGLFAGVAGAINVMMFGEELSQQERAQISGDGPDQLSSVSDHVNGDLLKRSLFGTALSDNSDADRAGKSTEGMLASASTRDELSTNAPAFGQTQALVDQRARIRAGGDVDVRASDVTRINVRSGGLAAGAVGVGMGAAVSKVRSTTVAAIGDAASVLTDGSLRVKTSDGEGGYNNVLAFTGAAGGFAGNIAVAVADSKAAGEARIGEGVTIGRWHVGAEDYSPDFHFAFTPAQKVKLRAQGMSDAEIAAEEKRRTLAYHLVHEQLIGLEKGEKPADVSDPDLELYWAMRERGTLGGEYAAYDPDYQPALTGQGDEALKAEIGLLAASNAASEIATREKAVENAVKGYDTTANRGAPLPDAAGFNVDGIYDPGRTDENYQRYWQARGVARRTVTTGTDGDGKPVTATVWVAGAFPASYSFTFANRAALIAEETARQDQKISENVPGNLDSLAAVYKRVHASLVAHYAEKNGDAVYDPAAALSAEQAAYWNARKLDVSAVGVEVSAVEANSVKAEAYGAAIGGFAAVGGQIAVAKKGGSLVAGIADAASAGSGTRIEAGTIAITAQQKGSAEAKAAGGNAGTYAAVGGVVAVAENSTDTTARAGNHALLSSGGDIALRANSAPRVRAEAVGVNVSGGASVGVSSATTRLSNSVASEIGNGVRILSGGNVAVEAVNAKPSGQENAYARAIAGGGGLLIGVSGAVAINRVTSTADARIGAGVTLDVRDRDGIDARNFTLLADSASSARIDATGIGVGFIGIGAVHAENDLDNKSRSSVGAGLAGNVSGTLRVASEAEERADVSATSGSGGIVAGAAAVVKNTIRNTTATTFANGNAGAGVTAGRLEIQALHDRAYAKAKSNSARASLVGYSGAWADTDFISDVDVILGSGIAASATGGISVEARNVVEKAQDGKTITAGSGGLFDMSSARSETTLDNSVDVSFTGARLRGLETAGMSVLASNNVVIADTVSLDAGGAIAGAVSESRVVNAGDGRDHARISVSGASELTTQLGAISLVTETDGDIDVRASSKTYGGAGGAGARANAFYTVDNGITIGGDAVLQAGRDLELKAGRGSIAVDTEAYAYNKTLIPISTKPNIDLSLTVNNEVKIGDAEVTALRDVIFDTRGPALHMKGYGEAEDWTKALKAILQNIWRVLTGRKPKPLKEIKHSSNDPVSNGSVDIGAGALVQAGIRNRQLLDIRLENGVYVDRSEMAGTSRAVDFSVDKGVNVSEQLRQEIVALEQALAIEGDADKREILRGELETLAFQLSSQLAANGGDLVTDVINVDDIAVDTGDVKIWTDRLTGTGTVKTSKKLEIVVDNQTSAMMRMGSLEVQSSRVGEVRLNGKAISSHGSVDVDIESAGPDGRLIAVNNRFESVDGQVTQPDLYLDGEVINRGGTIRIGSTGSLIINNDVEGQTVELLANDAIIQRYRLGFTHIGGLPYVSGSSGSMIAGGNVFLAGEYININGTIQAGIPVRELKLSQSMQSTIDDYDAIYGLYRQYSEGDISEAEYRSRTSGYSHDLVDDLLRGAESASVVKLTSFLDEGQPIVAGYNLATREIEVQRTEAGGGLVTLFGNILSTGNGKIKVADGFGDLAIDNEIDRDLVLHGLDTGQGIEGKVKIVDTAYKAAATADDPAVLARVTEITRDAAGKVVTRSGDRVEIDDGTGNREVRTLWAGEGQASAEASRIAHYDPKAGQTYNWLQMTADGAPECESLGAACGGGSRPVGGFFGRLMQLLGLQNSVSYDNKGKLDASKRIGVEFIGADIGQISVVSADNIHIVGNVTNTTGETSIVSRSGFILRRGEASIGAANLTLQASNGVIGGADDSGLWLDMVEGSGRLREAVAGHGVTLTETQGSLRFERIDAGAGDAVVTAADNLVGLDGNKVSGRSVKLVATGGSIGSQAARVNVDTGASAGVFNAMAFDDIHVRETEGDMRIERIRAGGTVDLDVAGSVLDANQLNENSGLSQSDREKRWAEAGLIGTAAEQSLDSAVQSIEDRNEREYSQYWQARGLSAEDVDADGDGVFEKAYSVGAYDPDYSFRFTDAERADMLAGNVSAQSIATMESERTASYHAVHQRIGEPDDASAYDPGYSYSVTAEERTVLEEGYQWTVEELSGSINKALFSDRTDTDPFIEDPNIVAGQLKIKAGGAIGEQRGVFELELPPEGQDIDETKQNQLFDHLAQAERDDIIYVYENASGQRYERIGETSPDGDRLVAVRIELKEDVDADIAGSVDIAARGDVFLGSEETDINILLAQSQSGDVRLKSRQGLTNARLDDQAAVSGENVVLEAAAESVGSEARRILVDVRNALSARAGKSIYLQQVSGDLAVDFIRAGEIADIRVAGGTLRDARGDRMTNIRARTVNLDAVSIGEAGRAFGVGQLGDSAARLNAVARGGDIHVEGTEEDLFLGKVELEEAPAPGRPQLLSLDVLAGALLKGAGTGVNVLANGADMTTDLAAAYGIGVGGPLDLEVHALRLENRLGLGIHVAEIDDLILLNAQNAAAGEVIDVTAAGNLEIERDGSVVTNNGDIRLIAAADGNGGDLLQQGGAGGIDAGTASVSGRGENIRLKNRVTADEVDFETLRAGRDIEITAIDLGSRGSFVGGHIDIDAISHSGGPELLDLAFADHAVPVERLELGVSSGHGVAFRPLQVMEAEIEAKTSRTVFPEIWVGRTAHIATNETTVTIDQVSPAIVRTGVQIHQRPNVAFQLDIDGYHFKTDARVIKFDRQKLTAIMIAERPVGQFADSAFDVATKVANQAVMSGFDLAYRHDLRHGRLAHRALLADLFAPGDDETTCGKAAARYVALGGICDAGAGPRPVQ